MSNVVSSTQFINYISEFKKKLVGRNNNPVSVKFKIDNRIIDRYSFQMINSNNQIVDLESSLYNYQFYGSFVDARNQSHTLFYSNQYSITSANVISFRVNTFTSEYLHNVKTPREIDITIKKKKTQPMYDEIVVLRDSGIAYPCPVQPEQEPTPVIAGNGLSLNGYLMSLTGTVLSGDGSTIAINNNTISYIGTPYTAGEGISIDSNNVISLTATIPTSTSQLENDAHFITPTSINASGIILQRSLDSNYLGLVLDNPGWITGYTAGSGISIENGVINCTVQGGGGGGATYTAGEGIGIDSNNVISLTATIPSTVAQLNDASLYLKQIIGENSINGLFYGSSTWKLGIDYDSLHNAGFAYTSAIPTGISTDKLQKIVIDSTVQDSGYVMQYDPTADVVYNTIATDNGLLTLNAVSGFENDIEIGKAATFENWVKVQGNLTGVAVGHGLNLIGELPEEFDSNNTQVFSRRIARINKDTTVQQISYNYNFYETPVPLTLKSTGNTTVTLRADGSPDAVTLSSRINDGEWTSYSVGDSITLTDGDEVSFKGINDHFSKTSNDKYTFVVEGDGTIEAFGSVKSLIGEDSTMNNYCFNKLFYYCIKLTDASKLVLPDKDLKDACFRNMFYHCESLTGAPEIKAEQIPYRACSYMFHFCSSLSSVPDLHASIIGSQGCQSMFNTCSSLIAAPAIPATRVYNNSCENMFISCSNMVTAPAILPATTIGDSCYKSMFANCTSLISACQLPAETIQGACYQNMFSGCVNLVKGPSILPAMTTYAYCYADMFRKCSSLTAAPKLPAKSIFGTYCYSGIFRECTVLSSVEVGLISWSSDSTTTHKWLSDTATNGVFKKTYTLPETRGDGKIPQDWTVEIYDYSGAPFTFEAIGDSVTVELHNDNDPGNLNLQYNKNDTGWQNLGINNQISLDAGDTLAFKGDGAQFNSTDWDPYIFKSTGNGTLKVYGNIMSLLTSSFEDKTEFDSLNCNTYVFKQLFAGMSNLVDASNLVIPATDLSTPYNAYIFMQMFDSCTALTAAPKLPATKLVQGCYYLMFNNCTSLSTAPELPATQLAGGCYQNMFQGCTSLTDAPDLPATTLYSDCYNAMFNGCSSLSSISVNFTDWNASYYTGYWVTSVAQNGTFTKPSDLSEINGDDYIPYGWTVVNK